MCFVTCTKNQPEIGGEYIGSISKASGPTHCLGGKQNNLRVMQANLPAYEGGLNADSLVDDLLAFSANTLIINAGGIMAFYPTKFKNQYTKIPI